MPEISQNKLDSADLSTDQSTLIHDSNQTDPHNSLGLSDISNQEPQPTEDKKNLGEQTEKDQYEFFKGTVQRVTYRSSDTGFGVIRAESDTSRNGFSVTTVVGTIPSTLGEGGTFVARGRWQTHPKFGAQFKAFSLTETLPTSQEAIIRYLSSGLIKGVGPKLAERIVEQFGEKTLSILEQDPDRLSEVSGIGESKIEEIKTIWHEKKEEREVLLFFQNYGISPSLARRIYQAYRARAVEIVKENPYILCEEVWGIGFLTADKIAIAIGIDTKSSERLMAGISYTLSEAQNDGHTFLPRDILLTKAKSLLSIAEDELLEKALVLANLQGLIVEYQDKFYTPLIFSQERKTAECIIKRSKRGASKSIPEHLVEEVISMRIQAVDSNPIVLSPEQKDAVKLAATSPLLVITGGPGCGKTTLVRSIGAVFKKAGLRIRLTAPTGRAAQRLQEVCSIEASTIHRLLKFDPMQRCFMHDESNYLPYDVLIVDESSMIDIPLASSLLKAVSPDTRLIFVGDADQLPSVGPGLFFSDLLQIDAVPKVKLTQLFRRAEDSSINDIAYQINKGVPPHIPQPDGTGTKDAYFLPVKDQNAASELIERLVCEQIPKRFNYHAEDITVLSPMNQGELGIIALNKRLQDRLVPKSPGAPIVKMGNTEFRVGDRVCQRVNNYNIHDSGVFNGEQGVIYGLDTEQKALYVKLWDGREITYKAEHISQLDLAYALTIHRSQGSEVPVVVLALHDSHAIMLERQLIYTAVTRAKKLLIVVGTKSALARATKRTRSSKRYTSFKDMVEEELANNNYSTELESEY